jgi:hypothetical protein
VLVLATLCVLGVSARAGEDEWHLTLAPAYGLVDFDARSPSGVGAFVQASYGITESLAVWVAASWTAHPVDADKDRKLPDGTIQVVGGMAGIRYAFDVLKTVPYLDVGLGVLAAQGAGSSGTSLAYDVGLGFDRLVSPHWSWGFVIEYHAFISDYSRLPVYVYAGPTVSVRWD